MPQRMPLSFCWKENIGEDECEPWNSSDDKKSNQENKQVRHEWNDGFSYVKFSKGGSNEYAHSYRSQKKSDTNRGDSEYSEMELAYPENFPASIQMVLR
jgi:hypothetical protein